MDQRIGSGDWAVSQRTPGNTLGLRAGDTLRSPDSLLPTHPLFPDRMRSASAAETRSNSLKVNLPRAARARREGANRRGCLRRGGWEG